MSVTGFALKTSRLTIALIVFRDPLFYSMACVIAFGLTLGTILSLLVVPVLYNLFMRVRPPGRRKAYIAVAAEI
jgi:Cu/Ag efflux pump CusA